MFALPRGDIVGYEIDGEFVRFFSCGEEDTRDVVLNRWIVPSGARSMEFLKMDFRWEYYAGAPMFYDNKGNLLKIGNR